VRFPRATRRVSRKYPASKGCGTVQEMRAGPLEVGSQVWASNHCKLRLSKAAVVSVAAKCRDSIPAGAIRRGERKQTVDDVSKCIR
jgi:hypothetical protein